MHIQNTRFPCDISKHPFFRTILPRPLPHLSPLSPQASIRGIPLSTFSCLCCAALSTHFLKTSNPPPPGSPFLLLDLIPTLNTIQSRLQKLVTTIPIWEIIPSISCSESGLSYCNIFFLVLKLPPWLWVDLAGVANDMQTRVQKNWDQVGVHSGGEAITAAWKLSTIICVRTMEVTLLHTVEWGGDRLAHLGRRSL